MSTQQGEVQSSPIPTELYTPRTLFTLAGSSTAVWLITLVLDNAFGINSDNYRWVGLIVALILSFVGATTVAKLNLKLGAVAFFNGLLIYVTTVGIHSLEQGAGKDKGNNSVQHASIIPWESNKPWWPATVLTDSIQLLQFQSATLKSRINEITKAQIAQGDSVKILKDSLHRMIAVKAKPDQSNTSTKCLELNKTLNAEVVRLKALLSAQPAKAVEPDQRNQAIKILSDALSANDQLMESLNKYQKAGSLKPLDQLDALNSLSERISTLKNSIRDYDKEIERLISGLR